MTSRTDTAPDYYRLLGISPEATYEEMRAAYRSKVRLWHPDLVAGETRDGRRAATEMTAQLNEAYECLRDPDRRAAYDTKIRVKTVTTRHRSTSRLSVTPRTLRCDLKPGDNVRFSLEIRADRSPGEESIQVRTAERLIDANFTVTAQAANSARITVRIDTTKLSAHRAYHIPITVTWGTLTGVATLVAHTTELRNADSNSTSHRQPTSSPRRHRARSSHHRLRHLTTISLGGIILPMIVLAWVSGLLPAPTPANPRLVATVGAGVVAATTWLLASSRLLHQPERLARIGVFWSHLMRWLGWALIGGSAVFLGIPALVLVLMVAAITTPILGLVVIALITGRSDSKTR